MSYEIYGFGDLPIDSDESTALQSLRESTCLGVFSSTQKCLIGFPLDIRPNPHSLVFAIGDSPHAMNAEYLLDLQNYEIMPGIQLPLDGAERLTLLTSLLSLLFTKVGCHRIAVCLTVCNQVESVKYLHASEISRTIIEDCSKESPPCVIYIIRP